MRAKTGRLRRERRVVRAVDGISFAIERGTIVGYLGPNGAGKSTTVKMLTGILVPSGGTIRVAELDPSRQRIELARRIGVVFGQRSQLWWDLPLGDSFDLLRHIYRVPAERHRSNLERFTEMLGLAAFVGTPVRQLSLGQRMRGELTAALLHDPEVVFLDEPTIGLDIVAKAAVREFLVGGEPGARCDRVADDARPRRHRAALLAAPDRRPRAPDLGRRPRRAEAALRAESGRSSSISRRRHPRSRCPERA